jgi:hypothetical protein
LKSSVAVEPCSSLSGRNHSSEAGSRAREMRTGSIARETCYRRTWESGERDENRLREREVLAHSPDSEDGARSFLLLRLQSTGRRRSDPS